MRATDSDEAIGALFYLAYHGRRSYQAKDDKDFRFHRRMNHDASAPPWSLQLPRLAVANVATQKVMGLVSKYWNCLRLLGLSLAPQPGVTQRYIAKNRPLTLA
jgi:hypothetical protein